jgi:hypothetical protein
MCHRTPGRCSVPKLESSASRCRLYCTRVMTICALLTFRVRNANGVLNQHDSFVRAYERPRGRVHTDSHQDMAPRYLTTDDLPGCYLFGDLGETQPPTSRWKYLVAQGRMIEHDIALAFSPCGLKAICARRLFETSPQSLRWETEAIKTDQLPWDCRICLHRAACRPCA